MCNAGHRMALVLGLIGLLRKERPCPFFLSLSPSRTPVNHEQLGHYSSRAPSTTTGGIAENPSIAQENIAWIADAREVLDVLNSVDLARTCSKDGVA